MLSRRVFLTMAALASSAVGASFVSCGIQDTQTDVIVIGAGHAGLAAAVSAVQNGAKVVVIEQRPFVGLNTHSDKGLFASSFSPENISACGDSPENHFRQSFLAGSSLGDPELLRVFVNNAPSTLQWLHSLGMSFGREPINSNSLWRRCYQPLHTGYIETLYREALFRGVEFAFNEKVVDLAADKNNGRSLVATVSIGRKKVWNARKAVIICTGGFGANKKIVSQYAPKYKDLTSDNEQGSSGEVLLMARENGALLTGMDRILCLPRPPGNLRSQGYLHLDVSRFLFINGEGRRFVSEDALRPVITEAFFEQGNRPIFEIADDATVKGYQVDIQRDLWRGIENGTVFRGKTLKELSEKISVSFPSLMETVERYNYFVDSKSDSDFGKNQENLSHKLVEGPFWAVRVEMMIHETLGGLVVDKFCRVLGEDGKPIKGFYAAGSVIGNLHGSNRLGGNGIASSITLGKIAGFHSAKEEPTT